MALDETVEELLKRVQLFERCYIQGFGNLLVGINCDAEIYLLEPETREELAPHMRELSGWLRDIYAGMPPEILRMDNYSAHMSVMRDVASDFAEICQKFIKGIDAGDEDASYSIPDWLGRISSQSAGVTSMGNWVIESLNRENIRQNVKEVLAISSFQNLMVVLAMSCQAQFDPEESPEDKELYYGEVKRLLPGIEDSCRSMIGRKIQCDPDFAPITVVGDLLPIYLQDTERFISAPDKRFYEELYDQRIGLLSAGDIFRKRANQALKRLRMCPGYENYAINVKHLNPGEYWHKEF